eukprot:PhM_4_TR11973/c0_g1_i1/m.83887
MSYSRNSSLSSQQTTPMAVDTLVLGDHPEFIALCYATHPKTAAPSKVGVVLPVEDPTPVWAQESTKMLFTLGVTLFQHKDWEAAIPSSEPKRIALVVRSTGSRHLTKQYISLVRTLCKSSCGAQLAVLLCDVLPTTVTPVLEAASFIVQGQQRCSLSQRYPHVPLELLARLGGDVVITTLFCARKADLTKNEEPRRSNPMAAIGGECAWEIPDECLIHNINAHNNGGHASAHRCASCRRQNSQSNNNNNNNNSITTTASPPPALSRCRSPSCDRFQAEGDQETLVEIIHNETNDDHHDVDDDVDEHVVTKNVAATASVRTRSPRPQRKITIVYIDPTAEDVPEEWREKRGVVSHTRFDVALSCPVYGVTLFGEDAGRALPREFTYDELIFEDDQWSLRGPSTTTTTTTTTSNTNNGTPTTTNGCGGGGVGGTETVW